MLKRLYIFTLLLLTSLVSFAQTYSVTAMTVGNWLVKLGDATATVPINLTNYGTNDVKKISYTLYYVNSQQSVPERDFVFSEPLPNGETATMQLPLGAGSTFGQDEIIFTVTKVDGNANSASIPYKYITRCTVNKVPHKRVLLEDYTALWCPNCPSGIIAMESLSRLYPDDFVGVSIHCTDALTSTQAYQDGMESTWGSGKPSVWMNRRDRLAGWDGRDMFENACKVVTAFDMGVTARWNAAKTSIDVEAKVEACMSQEAGVNYALAYVLTTSGLKGKYNQQVDPSYKTADNDPVFDPEFAPFKNLDNYYRNYYNTALTYNDVALASQGISTGVSETAFSQMPVGTPHYYQTTFDNISQYSVVQDPTKFTVIAMLINQKTKQVENVVKCSVSEPTASFSLNFAKSPWKTLYSDRAYTLPAGVEAYAIDEEGNLLPFADGTSAFNVAAHTALLLKSTQGSSYTVNYTTQGTAPTANALYGSSEATLTYAPGELCDNDVYYYKLANDASKGIGFYWAAANGAPFTSQADCCYLVLKRSTVTASNLRGFTLPTDVTGISAISSPVSSVKATYDLSGKPLKAAQGAGVYIVDGKKVLKTK